MNDDGRIVLDDWPLGFILGMGMRAKAWRAIVTTDFRLILAPIFSVNPVGRAMMPDVPPPTWIG
jgi:hypothetical protein